MKVEMEENKQRVDTHAARMAELEKKVQEKEDESKAMKMVNEGLLTREISKNATKKLMLKDREGELEDQRNKLKRRHNALLEEIEALPKKQREKILKK